MAAQLCPVFTATGKCDDSTCRLSHSTYPCEVCRLMFTSQGALDGHLGTQTHAKRTRSRAGNSQGFCELCNINIVKSAWALHVNGKPHRRMAKTSGVAPESSKPQPVRSDKRSTFCDVCDVLFLTNERGRHENTLRHRNALTFSALKSVLSEAAKDRNGLTMSHEDGVDFGVVEVGDAARGLRIEVAAAVSTASQLRRLGVAIVGSRARAGCFTVEATGNLPQSLITVILEQSLLGKYEDRLEVTFEDLALRQRFVVIRTITATVVGTRDVHELLKPSSPYIQKRKSARRDPENEVVRGIPPKLPPLTKHARKLPEYPIPRDLKGILEHNVGDLIQELQTSHLPSKSLNSETYGRFWAVLLWVEEYRAELDLQIFDMDDAVLEKKESGVLYWLRVPGLAEKRPSVIRDDRINVRPDGSEGKWFEGRVHDVQERRVGMRFSAKFSPPSATQRFNVRFKLNRIPVRRQHQALAQNQFNLDRIIAPTRSLWPDSPMRPVRREKVKFFNEVIAGNKPQVDAIMAILNLPEGAPPFVLFGPPGTGKTVTLVEAALQVVTYFPNYRLLVTAPSNSAADLIAERLSVVLGKEALFRLYSRSRRVRDVQPPSLLTYALINENEFDIPTLETLMKYRIVVCTSVSAAVPFTLGVPPGHFNGIIVDEAGQATEPEVMIAIKDLCDDKTNVVLAGDPKQLGPVVRSAVARQLGLAESYLQHLMDMGMYEPHTGYGKTVVKFVKNYRSHEAILKFPNARFYEDELIVCASDAKRNACLNASVLVNKKYPVVFHSVSGDNEREATSPSYFNILEAEQVKLYIDELIADRRLGIRYADIGVIAPYHAQVLKIRRLLDKRGDKSENGAKNVKVGSVEEFQGQERKVILVSTVRSSRDLVEFDLRHTLGFVSNTRRFNVAVTRAQALLIIVGDPDVLGMDPLWRSFINMVHINGGWRGPLIPWDPTEPVNEEGGYDAQARVRGMADLNDIANRLRAIELGEEDQAAVDRVVVEED